MRIWDINPGYLNDKSLLGEHVELHGLVSIIVNNKKGYSNHPETKRWVDFPWALNKRHQLLCSEMKLRGFNHMSPLIIKNNEQNWPQEYIDIPSDQFKILFDKYKNKKKGRIPLPDSAQKIWSHHKYSIMARDFNEYKKIGRSVSNIKPNDPFSSLVVDLIELMKAKPLKGGLRNALQHMWGYFKKDNLVDIDVESLSLIELLNIIQKLAYQKKEKYILESTALSDFEVWV